MRWIHPLSPEVEEPADVLGGKAHGLVVLRRLGLPVPPGFVIGTEACRAFLRHGRLPDGLDAQLAAAVADLEAATNRKLGGPERPLAVSVRSGAGASMPGMMTTVLNLGLTPQTAIARLRLAAAAVFSSWDTPRATTYRELHDIPHDLGTAVTVQAMVFGNRDDHSGAGVAFSRDPNTGEPVPFGEVLFGRQGDEVVSGRSLTRPLHDLAGREPTVWAGLLEAFAPGRGARPRRVLSRVHLRGRRAVAAAGPPGRTRRQGRCPGRHRPRRRGRDRTPRGAAQGLPPASRARPHGSHRRG